MDFSNPPPTYHTPYRQILYGHFDVLLFTYGSSPPVPIKILHSSERMLLKAYSPISKASLGS